MNQKPAYLRILAWPLLFFTVLTVAEIWAYMVGGYLLLGSVLDPTEAHTITNGLVLAVTALFVFVTWPMIAAASWRDGITAFVAIAVNLLANLAWQNWLTFLSDYRYDFGMSVVLVTIALVFNSATCVKFLMKEK